MTFPFTLTERIPTCSFLCESFRGTEAHFVENCHLLQDEAFLALLLSLWKGTTPIVKIFSCWSDFSVLPMTVFVCQHERKTRVIKKKSKKSYPICENLFLFLVMEEKHICMENASFLVSLLSPNCEKLFLSDKTNVYL